MDIQIVPLLSDIIDLLARPLEKDPDSDPIYHTVLPPVKLLPTRLKTGDGVGIEKLRSQGGRKGIESSFSVLYNEF